MVVDPIVEDDQAQANDEDEEESELDDGEEEGEGEEEEGEQEEEEGTGEVDQDDAREGGEIQEEEEGSSEVEQEEVKELEAPALPGNRPIPRSRHPPEASLPAIPVEDANEVVGDEDETPPPPPPRSYPAFPLPSPTTSTFPTSPPTPLRRATGSTGSIPRSPLTREPSASQPRNLLGVNIPQSSFNDSPNQQTQTQTQTFPSDFGPGGSQRRQRTAADDKDANNIPVSAPLAVPSYDELMSLSNSLGAQISSAAYSKLNERSSTKPTSSEFIAYCFSRATDSLPPSNNSSYGITIAQYLPLTKSTAPTPQPLDEPRAGDIAIFLDARFKHNLTTTKVGSMGVPHIAIVAAWDSKKGKLRVVEVAEGKSGVVENAYRMIEDLKSGSVQVHRVRKRI